jgi:GNAT superfamily N-acetyltransferase
MTEISLIRVLPGQSSLVMPLFLAYSEFYGQAIGEEQARAYIEDGLSQGDAVIFLATQRSDHVNAPRPVGFAQLHPSRSSALLARRWIINDLYVVPDLRRSGIARSLLEMAKAFALTTNARDLVLRTAQNNNAARALYESLGWVSDDGFVTYRLLL